MIPVRRKFGPSEWRRQTFYATISMVAVAIFLIAALIRLARGIEVPDDILGIIVAMILLFALYKLRKYCVFRQIQLHSELGDKTR